MITGVCLVLLFPLSLSAEWKELQVLTGESVWASSELTEMVRGEEIVYSAENLFDGDPATCWAEGAAGSGIGESILILADRTVNALSTVNGFARSENLFRKNGRVKELQVSLVAAFTAPGLVSETDYLLYFSVESERKPVLTLEDTMTGQSFTFPFSREEQELFLDTALEQFKTGYPMFYDAITGELGDPVEDDLVLAAYSMFCIRLEITDVFPGSKYEDTCLSEVALLLE